MLEPSYPQTDTRQSERQRERQGNVVDYAEQEFERSRETLRQMDLAHIPQQTEEGEPVTDVPAEGFGHKYPGTRNEEGGSEH